MSALLAPAATVAAFAFVLIGLPLLAQRVRRGGTGAGFLGPFEEIFGNPGHHRTRFVVEAQQERPAQAPAPGDPADQRTTS